MNIKQKSKKSIRPQLQSLCFKDPVMKNLGQRAFIAYFKSVHIQKDKDVFKVEELPAESYAASLGLPGAPKIKIKGGESNKEKKNASRKLIALAKQTLMAKFKPGTKKLEPSMIECLKERIKRFCLTII